MKASASHDCKIVNLRHDPEALAKGAIRIDRQTFWGNPFRIGPGRTREEVIALYRAYLWRRIQAGEIRLNDLAFLHGKTLACWCAPLPCHGHVLARAASWAAARLKE